MTSSFYSAASDLFNGPLVAAADNCHAGYSRVIRLSYRKGIDIKASSGKQARYLAQDTGSVFNKNRVYFFSFCHLHDYFTRSIGSIMHSIR